MYRENPFKSTLSAKAVATSILIAATAALAQTNTGKPELISTGQQITPLAPPGARFEALNPGLADAPEYTAGQAETTVVSPDKKTLLVLTSGYNLWNYTSGANAGNTNPTDSTEWIFVFDISRGAPVQKQAIPVPNSFSGIAFDPSGTRFYVSGGDDDNVHTYTASASGWAESGTPIKLGHLPTANTPPTSYGGLGIEVPPEAAGIAIAKNGTKMVVVNFENDSISVLTAGPQGFTVTGELPLRPGKLNAADTGVPGGEYPYWVTFKSSDTVYISSIRDREVIVARVDKTPRILNRIKVPGQPNRMILNANQSRLYVAQDNRDSVAVIATANNGSMIDEVKITAPVGVYANKQGYKGANPNSLALSPDEKTLYVTNGGENAVAVLRLSDTVGNSYVAGLIPTGFYPNSISTSGDGKMLYIVNGKSATGPNPGNCRQDAKIIPTFNCNATNEYSLQLIKAGFQSLPTPDDAELSTLSETVAQNNHWMSTLTADQAATMAAVHNNIKHVIYIIKENRTYDQILGDLPVGNGDPNLAQFPQQYTPNFHMMANNFVDLDNFSDTSNVSFDGWAWSTSARTTDIVEKEYTVNYAGRGVSYDTEGENRNINVGYGTMASRHYANPLTPPDPDLLPGSDNIGAPDAPNGEDTAGYLWNTALNAKLSVRNYGCFIDLLRYNLPASLASINIPELRDPFASHTQVAYGTNPVLRSYTDPYFRGFDNTLPDYYRYKEWEREFDAYAAKGSLPNLTLLRLMHDHFGNFTVALDGVNTPELQIADNDYAVGLVIDKVAHSQFKDNTLVFVIEDDAQDGPDHVDAHRSTAFVVGPYVKQNYVDSSRYTTVSMLRTIEDVLGTKHLSLNDATTLPMADIFDANQKTWDYTAVPSAALKATQLPIPPSAYAAATTANIVPLHGPGWWGMETKGMNFKEEDQLDSAKFNRVLWKGTMGNRPYPTVRSGRDLRMNRQQLLEQFNAAKAGARQPEQAKGAGLAPLTAGSGN